MDGGIEDHAEDWFDLVAATLAARPFAAWSIVAIDPASGRLLGATPGVEALLGRPVPDHLGTLVRDGVVLGRDVDRYAAHLERGRSERPADPVAETAFFFADDLHLRLPGGDRVLDTTLLHHRRPRWERELVLVTLYEREDAGGQAAASASSQASAPSGDAGEMWALHDVHGRLLGLDPAWAALYPEPDALLGTLASVLVHPDDLTPASLSSDVRPVKRALCHTLGHSSRSR